MSRPVPLYKPSPSTNFSLSYMSCARVGARASKLRWQRYLLLVCTRLVGFEFSKNIRYTTSPSLQSSDPLRLNTPLTRGRGEHAEAKPKGANARIKQKQGIRGNFLLLNLQEAGSSTTPPQNLPSTRFTRLPLNLFVHLSPPPEGLSNDAGEDSRHPHNLLIGLGLEAVCSLLLSEKIVGVSP